MNKIEVSFIFLAFIFFYVKMQATWIKLFSICLLSIQSVSWTQYVATLKRLHCNNGTAIYMGHMFFSKPCTYAFREKEKLSCGYNGNSIKVLTNVKTQRVNVTKNNVFSTIISTSFSW